MFIDRVSIVVKAGAGGDGSVAFRREKYIPRGGPNGGDGGRGGDLYLKVNPRLKTLLDFVKKPNFEAQRGQGGMGNNRFGKSGDPLYLEVPCGTTVYSNGKMLVDLVKEDQTYLVATGGRGGRGNVHFKSSTRQAPRISEKGEPTQAVPLDLQLRLIADVGLIGFPNAGKSTLLSRFTRAHPKIANYPFTTLAPNLGVAQVFDREVILADIPGLIEGSHQGKGLGHRFLQHIERTRILLHVVDPFGFEGENPEESIRIINEELAKYSPALARKKQIIVINKMDLTGAKEVFEKLKKKKRPKRQVFAVSGVSGEGLPDVLKALIPVLEQAIELPPPEPEPEPPHIVLEPEYWVEQTPDKYIVRGKRVVRLVHMTNFKFEESVRRTQNILKKMGVERALMNKGATAGDLIRIGDFEFIFEPVGQETA